MGQKVSPIGFRVGINKAWDSTWYAGKEDFAKFLLEDSKIRKFLNKEYAQASISKIFIERTKERLIVNIHTGRPAVLIGQKGANVEIIKKQLKKIVSLTKNLVVNIKEVKKVDLDAQLVA
ncbi:MAG: 30S ribosomal protein S3, partial [Clostridia bacterium]|nr:30S ribosomal protein S3 [Clostridia bacterium]